MDRHKGKTETQISTDKFSKFLNLLLESGKVDFIVKRFAENDTFNLKSFYSVLYMEVNKDDNPYGLSKDQLFLQKIIKPFRDVEALQNDLEELAYSPY